MSFYTVTWEIELEADSPREAAEMARLIQLDPASQATHFEVEESVDHGRAHIDYIDTEPLTTPARPDGLCGQPLRVDGYARCIEPYGIEHDHDYTNYGES